MNSRGDYLLDLEIIGYYDSDEYNSDEYFVLKLNGDSMFPLCDGDMVVVKKQEHFKSGQTCVVLISKDTPIIRDVIKTNKGVMLISKNPNYTPIDYSYDEIVSLPIQIIGLVVEAKIKGVFKQ